MGLTIITDTRQDLVVSQDRLWLTADRERVVPDGDPEAAFLLCGAGSTMLRTEAERYGLIDPKTPVVDAAKLEAADPAMSTSEEPAHDAELDGLTLNDLRIVADRENVDTSGMKTKAQVREAIEAQRAGSASTAADGSEDAGDGAEGDGEGTASA